MRLCMAITGAALVVLTAPTALAQTYDLSFRSNPSVGHVFKETESSKLSMKMKMVSKGKVMLSTSENKADSWEVTRTVLEVADGRITKERLEFAKAFATADGEKQELAIAGKSVIVEESAGKTTFTCEDGTPLGEQELDALERIHKPVEKEGGPSGDELLAPAEPVKVGGSWKPDVGAVAMDMLDLSGEQALDAEKSSIKMTLVKVVEKGGVSMAKVKGTFKLYVYEIGELKLEKPVLTKITVVMDMAIDGSVPDGTAEMKMQIKGTAPMELGHGEEGSVQLNMNAEFKKTASTVQP
jgi:hypothetical protein